MDARSAARPQARARALVVDQNPNTATSLVELLESLHFQPLLASSAREALEKCRSESPVCVLVDFDLLDMPAPQLVRLLRTAAPNGPPAIVALARDADVRTAVEAVRAGAADCLDKSMAPDEMRRAVEAVLQASAPGPTGAPELWAQDQAKLFAQYEQLFHGSERMRAVERLVLQVADTSATVLIQGETGVGKDLVARAVHYLSDRASKPWMKVNCSALPPELLESEFFGHEKGAFTGATSRKPGRFELAHGGTLFLDEIGDLPIGLQSKLLHVLQDNEFFRIGGRELIKVDVRVIAATNRSIQTMVANGLFREDLYYRLNVVTIWVPPLRERPEEIPSLVDVFREKFSRQFHRRAAPFSPTTLDLFMSHSWPGNIRELENLIKRYVVLEDEALVREEIELRRGLEGAMVPPRAPAPPATLNVQAGLRELTRQVVREAERRAIQEILERVRWNRAEAARVLRISYKALLYKMKELGLSPKIAKRS